MNLLIKSKKNSQEIVSVTPQSAGWRYISFSARQLARGNSITLSDDANELCAVVLSGIASARTDGLAWNEIGERKSVFEDASPYAVYVPPRTKLTLTAQTDVELAVAGAPAKGELPVRLIEPAAIRRSVRGKALTRATFAISCPRMNPLNPSLSSK
jgi:5-deoxy-glucuronate isomerase